MKNKDVLLFMDAMINLLLGVLLMFFPQSLVTALGIPNTESAFYPSILGAVLFGIGLALLIQRRRGDGLGLRGAIAINLSGGVVLALWLVFGNLQLPLHGLLLLWGLTVLLVGISLDEMLATRNSHRDT